jgi:hypothetical protein
MNIFWEDEEDLLSGRYAKEYNIEFKNISVYHGGFKCLVKPFYSNQEPRGLSCSVFPPDTFPPFSHHGQTSGNKTH